MRREISKNAKDLLNEILEKIQAEGLLNHEVVWIAENMRVAEVESSKMSAFVIREFYSTI